jgi:hypothetical protein
MEAKSLIGRGSPFRCPALEGAVVRTRSVTGASASDCAVGQQQLLLHPQPERHVRAEPAAPEDMSRPRQEALQAGSSGELLA